MLRRGAIEHGTFRDLPEFLRSGDVLVLNETRVIAARIFGKREPTGGQVELLLLRPTHHGRYDPAATRWQALGKPGRNLRAGQKLSFGDLATATVTAVHEDGVREIEFTLKISFESFLERAGAGNAAPHDRATPTQLFE